MTTPSFAPTAGPAYASPTFHVWTAYWPVVILQARDGATLADYQAGLEAFEREVIAQGTVYAVLTDATQISKPPPADVRRYLSEWMKRNAEGATSVGSVTIIGSSIVRGALTAMYWLFEPPTPQGVVGTFGEAQDWVARKLEAAGQTVPQRFLNLTEMP